MDDDARGSGLNHIWPTLAWLTNKVLAFIAYFAATALLLAAYDALVLFAISLGIGEWRTKTLFAFLTLLAGIPAALAIGLLVVTRRHTRFGWFSITLAVLTLVVVLFLNAAILGCHPIWEGRGACT